MQIAQLALTQVETCQVWFLPGTFGSDICCNSLQVLSTPRIFNLGNMLDSSGDATVAVVAKRPGQADATDKDKVEAGTAARAAGKEGVAGGGGGEVEPLERQDTNAILMNEADNAGWVQRWAIKINTNPDFEMVSNAVLMVRDGERQ
jgi:hypothetical protein